MVPRRRRAPPVSDPAADDDDDDDEEDGDDTPAPLPSVLLPVGVAFGSCGLKRGVKRVFRCIV